MIQYAQYEHKCTSKYVGILDEIDITGSTLRICWSKQ